MDILAYLLIMCLVGL